VSDGLRAALERCALADRSILPRILATGPDLLDLLHRLSTNAVKDLEPGEGRATVLTTPKGRIAHRLAVHRLPDAGVLLVGGTGGAGAVLEHFRRFTFAEQLGLSDVTDSWAHFAVVGPQAPTTLTAAGLPVPTEYGCAAATLAGARVFVAGGDGLGADGCSVFVPQRAAGEAVWNELARVAGAVLDAPTLEAWRILRMRPAAETELTEDRNPLEAGLRAEIDFAKGCYVGQEVVARLNTYDKVVRRLVRLEFEPGSSAPGRDAGVWIEGREVGVVTSSIVPPGSDAPAALAFVRRESAVEGAIVRVDDSTARIAAVAS